MLAAPSSMLVPSEGEDAFAKKRKKELTEEEKEKIQETICNENPKAPSCGAVKANEIHEGYDAEMNIRFGDGSDLANRGPISFMETPCEGVIMWC